MAFKTQIIKKKQNKEYERTLLYRYGGCVELYI